MSPATPVPIPTIQVDLQVDAQDFYRQRILHTLEVFPFLSASMIHVGIGTASPSPIWKPVLQDLVNSGEVVMTEISANAPSERRLAYTIYHLSSRAYPGFNVAS